MKINTQLNKALSPCEHSSMSWSHALPLYPRGQGQELWEPAGSSTHICPSVKPIQVKGMHISCIFHTHTLSIYWCHRIMSWCTVFQQHSNGTCATGEMEMDKKDKKQDRLSLGPFDQPSYGHCSCQLKKIKSKLKTKHVMTWPMWKQIHCSLHIKSTAWKITAQNQDVPQYLQLHVCCFHKRKLSFIFLSCETCFLFWELTFKSWGGGTVIFHFFFLQYYYLLCNVQMDLLFSIGRKICEIMALIKASFVFKSFA